MNEQPEADQLDLVEPQEATQQTWWLVTVGTDLLRKASEVSRSIQEKVRATLEAGEEAVPDNGPAQPQGRPGLPPDAAPKAPGGPLL